MTKTCYNCGTETVKEMFNYPVCDSCKFKLKLLTEATIKKQYAKSPEEFSAEIQRRLEFIEKDYISKKIKLLYIKEKIQQ